MAERYTVLRHRIADRSGCARRCRHEPAARVAWLRPDALADDATLFMRPGPHNAAMNSATLLARHRTVRARLAILLTSRPTTRLGVGLRERLRPVDAIPVKQFSSTSGDSPTPVTIHFGVLKSRVKKWRTTTDMRLRGRRADRLLDEISGAGLFERGKLPAMRPAMFCLVSFRRTVQMLVAAVGAFDRDPGAAWR